MNNPSISIILPFYNQGDHISQVIVDYIEELKSIHQSYEIIPVINGPKDDSFDICRKLALQYNCLRPLESSNGSGWGLAVKMGIANAKGDLICYTNSARTTPKDLVLLLLNAVSNPNKVIKANRRVREGLMKKIGSLIYNFECRTLFDLANWDINGTPKIFPRKFNKLLTLTQNDDLIDAEFLAICRQEQYPILEVPIVLTVRHSGRSTTNIKSAINMYCGAYRLWKKFKNNK